MASDSRGVLYVVGTPLGNLEDLSGRARRTLAEVDIVAAEDTRRTRGLLSSIGLKRALIAYHAHNEARRAGELLDALRDGKAVALVSDAGTPTISDPGIKLVAAALAGGYRVICIPGPSAVIAALSISGIDTGRFAFEGFLPRRAAARRAHLAKLRNESRTMVFYEAVHRLTATFADLVDAFGPDRKAALARELTKIHESLIHGTLSEIAADLGERIPLKGEFVVVVAGAPDAVAPDSMVDARQIFEILRTELSSATAAKLTARITGQPRRAIYRLAGENVANGES